MTAPISSSIPASAGDGKVLLPGTTANAAVVDDESEISSDSDEN